MEKDKLKYMLLILIGAISYGVLSTLAKMAYKDGFTLGEISFLQVLIGTIILWIIVFLDKKAKKKVSKKEIKNLLISGIPAGLTTITYYRAVQEIPASMAVLLLFQFTWIGIFLDCIIERKKISKIQVISILILVLGTLLSSNALTNGMDDLTLKGVIYGLLSAVSYTLFTFVNGKVAIKVNSKKRSAIMLLGSLLLITVCYPPVFIGNPHIVLPLLKYVIVMAILGAVIPPLCFSIGVPIVGVSLTSILASVELPSAILVSMLVLHERVLLLQWVGVFMVLVGIIFPIVFLGKKSKN